MRKVMWLALREYKTSVRTKGFIIGLIIFPIFMGGSSLAYFLLKDRVDTTDKRLAVVDRSGVLAEMILQTAEERNAKELHDKESGKKIKPAFIVEIVEPDETDPSAQKLALSNRIRNGGLYAFLVIAEDVMHPAEGSKGPHITYHSKNAALDDLRDWLAWPINNYLRKQRLDETGVDPSAVQDIFRWMPVSGLGLVSVDEGTGAIKDAQKSHEGEAIGIPMIMAMLMFMMIMMGATPLLQSVMEEKSQRIAEVLLGSIQPFQFMMGKVIGGLAVSFTGGLVYVVGGIIAVRQFGLAEYIPYDILPWFFVYMLLAIVMFGALLASLGAACNDSKEAQAVTLPAFLPMMIPMFILFPVLKEPLSGFATGLSLFPFFTPMLMTLRISTPGGIPAWQPWAGLVGVLLFSALIVWAGGRIFRVGILMQGTPPKFSNLVRWVIRG
jgi:ABC-2 type transport system permease protein